MTLTRSSRSRPRVSFPKARALLALGLLGALGLLQLLASVGCSSGAICYRNTDCPYASDCKQGQCVRRVSSEASAGASAVDDGAAGASN